MDILAPAVGEGTTSVTGTSASAAVVAGAAALLHAADPAASNATVVGRLARTADAAGTAGTSGNGRLNLARALEDSSTAGVTPAGAGNDGGPFVGPYTAAAAAVNDVMTTTAAASAGAVFAASGGLPVTGSVTSASPSPSDGTVTWTLLNNGSKQVATSAATAYKGGTLSGTIPLSGVAAGTYSVKASFSGYATNSKNYLASSGTATEVVVAKQGSSTSAADASRAYSTPQSNVRLSATVAGANATPADGTVAFKVSDSAGTTVGTPPAAVALSNGAAAVDYTLPGKTSGTFTITATYSGGASTSGSSDTAVLTVGSTTSTVVPIASDLVYGSALSSLDADVKDASGALVSGGTVTYTVKDSSGNAKGSQKSASVADGKAPAAVDAGVLAAGTYSVVADFSGTTGVGASTATKSLKVSPKPITVTGGSAGTTYGDPAPALTASATGLVGSETLTLTASSTGTASGAAAGTYPVTVAVADGTGKAANYAVTTNAGTLTIGKRALTVTANAASRVYGDGNPAFTGSVSNAVAGDGVAATYAAAQTASTDVGTYTSAIAPTVTATGSKLDNYTFTAKPADLTITAAPLTVTAANASRTYGDANPAFGATVSGAKNGDVLGGSASSVATAADAAGTYAIVPAATGPKVGNYAVTKVNGTLTVGKAALTVAAGSGERVYGAANPTVTASVSGLKNSDRISATASSAAGPSTPVGDAPVTSTLSDPDGRLGNYNVSAPNGKLTIKPAPLTVKASDASKVYGEAVPAGAVTASGLVNGESLAAATTGTLGFDTTATSSSPVGSYPVTPKGLSAGNYAVSFAAGSLSVTKKDLDVKAPSKERAYGGDNGELAATFDGFVLGQGPAALSKAPTCTTTATEDSAVGAYPVTCSGVESGNYAPRYHAGTISVGKALLEVSVGNATRQYGDANPAPQATVKGGRAADEISADVAIAADAGTPVGTYAITPSAKGKNLGNYSVQITQGTLTVTQAPLTVTARNAEKVYGDANPALSGDVVGIKNRDPIDAEYATTANALTEVGTSSITAKAKGDRLGNYRVTESSGTLTVKAAPLSITADSKTKVYGDANPAFTGKIEGIRNDDALEAGYASSADAGSDVGEHFVTPSVTGARSRNYTVTHTAGTLKVTPAYLAVTTKPESREYGEANPALSGLLLGVKNNDAISATWATRADRTTDAGKADIVPTLSDTDGRLKNYEQFVTGNELTITKAQLDALPGSKSRAYGDENGQLTGAVTGRVKNDDGITFGYATSASTKSDVGDYDVTVVTSDPKGKGGNYTLSHGRGKVTVTPGSLVLDVSNASCTYGDDSPAYSHTLGGVRNSDVIEVAYSAPSCSTTDAGDHPIAGTLSGAKLGNYGQTKNSGTLTIGQRPVDVTANDAEREYGDSNPAFAVTVAGLLRQDKLAGTPAFTAASNTADAGSYDIAPSGLSHKNYRPVYKNGTLTVRKADLVITTDPASREYGEANPAFTGGLTGAKNGDVLKATRSTTAGAATEVGDVDISAALDDTNGRGKNYVVRATGSKLTITPAPLSATPDNASRAYGDDNGALTGSITKGRVKNNDGITFGYETSANAGSDRGDYEITVKTNDPKGRGKNYALGHGKGKMTVTPGSLVLDVADKACTYGDDSNPSYTHTLGGVRNGDAISVGFDAPACSTTDAGDYVITGNLSGAKLGNYGQTKKAGKLTVGQRPVDVTANDEARDYGDLNPLFSLAVGPMLRQDKLEGVPTFATNAANTSGVGEYDIVPSGLSHKNYRANFRKGKLTIRPTELDVTALDQDVEYGDGNAVSADNRGGTASSLTYHYGRIGSVLGSFRFNEKAEQAIAVTPACRILGANGTPVDPALSSQLPPADYQIVCDYTRGANYKINHKGGKFTVRPKQTTTIATTTPTQYSDVATLSATVNPATTGSGAPWPGLGKGLVLPTGKVQFEINTQADGKGTWNPFGAAASPVDGRYTQSAKLNQAPGNYQVRASFVPDTGNARYFRNSGGTATQVVMQENANVDYSGSSMVFSPSTTNLSATVQFRATVTDVDDGTVGGISQRGDISNASVSFYKDVATGTPLCTAAVGLLTNTDTTVGSAGCSAVLSASNPGTNYTIVASVSRHYKGDTPTTVNVAVPTGTGSITGGGFLIVDSTTAGSVGATPGLKNNFGFNVKNSNKNLSGTINTIIRKGNGDLYQVKGNAMTSLTTTVTSSSTGKAAFQGKASVQKIFPDGTVDSTFANGGNAQLKVSMTDNGEPGSTDKIYLEVYLSTGQPFYISSYAPAPAAAATPQERTIGNGNLQVR